METSELIEIISRGEDGKNQFKADARNNTQLAAEMVAFCNSGGGRLFLGVSDNGSVSGLQREDVSRLNLLISDAATNLVKPSINPETENVRHPDGIVIVVKIPDGLSKPYMDNAGAIWVKSGSDKRKVTSREEIQRMLQKSGLIHGDEVPAHGVSIASIDMDFFSAFYEK
ncbi:MAG TPA: ATP-binding protein, partial [Candidatus Ozemobacteraceae bacterium]|nr:ATP-binding protein [Candidatus Ozemobacteraceae bacterium]